MRPFSSVAAVRGIVVLALFVSDIAVADGQAGEMSARADWFLGGVIYETSPLVMSESGTLGKVTKRLPEIRELGVKTLYLMPIFEHEPILIYRIYDYYKIAPGLGTQEDLRELVKRAHELGMRVLLDLIIAHSPAGKEIINWPANVEKTWSRARGPLGRMWRETKERNKQRLAELKKNDPETYVKAIAENLLPSYSPLGGTRPEWFLRDPDGNPVPTYPNPGWGLAFDYSNPEVHNYFADICAYYVREFDIDGWRVDAPQDNFDPKRFPNASNSLELLRAVHKAIKAVKPDAILFSERAWTKGGFRWEGPPIFDEVCEISYRDWLRWEMAYRRTEGKDFSDFSSEELAICVAKSTPQHGRYRANHVGTHDTERVHGMYPDVWRALVIIQYTLPGVPMIYGGQEIGETDRFLVDWEKGNNSIRAWHIKLGSLLPRESLVKGAYAPLTPQGDPVCAFVRSTPRELAVTVANFRKQKADVKLPLPLEELEQSPNDRYRVLDGIDGSQRPVTRAQLASLPVTVPPGDARILFVTPVATEN